MKLCMTSRGGMAQINTDQKVDEVMTEQIPPGGSSRSESKI